MKVLLVDDHPLILSALKAMIEKLSPGVVVNAVSSAREARFTLKTEQDHDLMLLDLQLGDANGFELLTEVRRTNPELSVVVLSSSDRASDVILAIDQGAMGFLPKRMTTEDLADALRLVMAGGIFVPTMSIHPVRDADEPEPPAAQATAGTRSWASRRASPTCCCCCCRASRTRTSRAAWACRSRPSRTMWRPCCAPWASARAPRRCWRWGR
jgi:DNA-binding NarL/FixJ family response regulator